MESRAAAGRPAEDGRLSFLLDTDTCSAYLKGTPLVFNRFLQYTSGLAISTITLGELFTWALRAHTPPQRLQAVQDFLTWVVVHDVTPAVAREFGALRADLFDAGTPVPDMDLVNAAVALIHNLTLVTHNTQDYAPIPGLRLVDWLIP
jgi:tRNA(fMet)-specific endonuclease VapC